MQGRSDLDRLQLVVDHLPDERLVQYLEVMRGHGRDDYPVRAMWNALLAGIVFQHESLESLLRELARNPSLMDACGFDPLPMRAQPNNTFYDTGGELANGIRYGHLRPAAHTDGDLYVFFPDENVIAVGDAVSGDGWPFVDWWTGGWIGGIVGTLELILSLMDDDTALVPGRGPVLSKAQIEQQIEMYNTVYNRLSTMLNNGFGPDEAVAAAPTAEFDEAMGPPAFFVRRSFESLWAYLSPDA